MKKKNYVRRKAVAFFAIVFSSILLSVSSSLASYVSESFDVVGDFPVGSVVSVNKEDAEKIELTTVSNSERVLGVVGQLSSSALNYSKGNSLVTVSVSGEVEVFVSDMNGEVKSGDYVTASWLQGVAMKLEYGIGGRSIGIAIDDFDPDSATEYGEVETPRGIVSTKVDVIRVRLLNNESVSSNDSESGTFLGIISNLAGKNVSFASALVASLIFICSLTVAGFFTNSSIRSSFISIGRNPMASSAIYKNLLQVTSLVLLIIMIGTALSYVVLVV